MNVYLLGKANDFSSRGGRPGHDFAGRVGPCYGLAMTGDYEQEQRRWRVLSVLRQGLIAWAVMHLFASGMVLYAIYKPDPAGAKIWTYLLIGLGPVAVAGALLQARAEWLGKDDTEFAASVAALSIAGGLGLVWWYLG